MKLDKYQDLARRTAIYPNQGAVPGLIYCALGASGEAGEIANKVKKIMRDEGVAHLIGQVAPERIAAIKKEIGGTLWYLANLCAEMGISLNDVARENLEILADRAARGALQGEGDDR